MAYRRCSVKAQTLVHLRFGIGTTAAGQRYSSKRIDYSLRKCKTNNSVELRGTDVVVPPVDVWENMVIDQGARGLYVSIDDGATIVDSRIKDGVVSEGSQLTGTKLAEVMIGNGSTATESPIELNVGDSGAVRL